VNLQALLNRLSIICRSRIGSAVSAPRSPGVSYEAVLVCLSELFRGAHNVFDQRGELTLFFGGLNCWTAAALKEIPPASERGGILGRRGGLRMGVHQVPPTKQYGPILYWLRLLSFCVPCC
jgi:hypothetical protein